MKVLAILSNKGGAGKTTLALSLAVAAVEKGKTAAVIDVDPQASAAEWGDGRESDEPAVVSAQATRLAPVLKEAEKSEVDLVVIDTPPRSEDSTMRSARAADFCLLVARPSIYDLRALSNSADVLALAGVPGAVVLNAVPPQGSHGDEAQAALEGFGLEVVPLRVVSRAAHYNSAISSQTAIGFEPHGKAAIEIRDLYEWVSKRLWG